MYCMVRSCGSSFIYNLSIVSAVASCGVGCVCVRMSLRMLECKSASLVMMDGVSFPCFRVWDQVLSPPTGGSASVNIM